MTTRELRAILFELPQEMTIKELRRLLFEVDSQDAEITRTTINDVLGAGHAN